MSNLRPFSVFYNDNCIDIVYYSKESTAEEVRTSLINHDNYHPAISVIPGSARDALMAPAKTTRHLRGQ